MWQPHSDGWGQWPIQQSAYTNVPTDQVDWGALAQQWIAHKEMTVHVPTGHGGGDINVHGHGPAYPSWGWNAPQANPVGPDWNSGSGLSSSWHSSGVLPSATNEAPAPSVPQYVDYGHGNYEVQGFDYNHGGVATTSAAPTNFHYQAASASTNSHPAWPPEPLPQPPPPPPPPEEIVEDNIRSLLPVPDSGLSMSDVAAPHRAPHHHQNKRQSQQHTAPAVVSSLSVSDTDEAASIIDAAKRKILPSWIREGLEKMEREKAKKVEREKLEKEREEKEKLRIAAEKAALEALGSEKSGEPTIPRKSRFDVDDSDGANGARKDKTVVSAKVGVGSVSAVDVAQTSAVALASAVKQPVAPAVPESVPEAIAATASVAATAATAVHPEEPSGSDDDEGEQLSAEEKQRQLIEKVKEMLTIVLRDVTDEQIRAVAKETYAKCRQNASKAPAKQLAKSSALASLTVFGGGDDSDDSESGSDRGRAKSTGSSSESDDEKADYRLRKKKAEFHKAQRERLLRLEREEQHARDTSSTTAKEKHSSGKKVDSVTGRDDGKSSGDSNYMRQPGSTQPLVPGHSGASPSSVNSSSTDDRTESHERPQRVQSPGDHKHDRHEGGMTSATRDHKYDVEAEHKPRQGEAARTKDRETRDDGSHRSTARSSKRSLSPDSHKHGSSSRNSRSGTAVKEDGTQRVSREAALSAHLPEQDKHSEPGRGGASSMVSDHVGSGRSRVVSSVKSEAERPLDKETRRSLTREGSSAETSGSSGSDSDSNSSDSSRNSRSKHKPGKRVIKPEKDDARDRRVDRHSQGRRSESARSKHSSDKARSSRKSVDKKKSSSSRKRSRRSRSRDSSRRHDSHRKEDTRERDRRSSRSCSRRGHRSRSPVTDRKTSSGKDRHRERSEDRSSKRKRRDASTSESEERGGKTASHRTSRWDKLTPVPSWLALHYFLNLAVLCFVTMVYGFACPFVGLRGEVGANKDVQLTIGTGKFCTLSKLRELECCYTSTDNYCSIVCTLFWLVQLQLDSAFMLS